MILHHSTNRHVNVSLFPNMQEKSPESTGKSSAINLLFLACSQVTFDALPQYMCRKTRKKSE